MGSRSILGSTHRSTVGHGDSRMRLRMLRMTAVRLGIGVGRHVLRPSLVASGIVLAVSVVAASGVGHVWNHLHTAGDSTGRATTPSRISRCRRATKTFVELLQQCARDIVGRDVDGICDAHDDK